jgi:hypothetical protein
MQDTEEQCFIHKVRYTLTIQKSYTNSRTVDDMFLKTTTWDNVDFRISVADLATHVQWQATIGSKLPKGSNYTIEIGHNGNGNIEVCILYNN